MAYIGGSTFPRSKEYLHWSRSLRTKHPANLSICRLKDPKERHLHHTVSRRPSAKMSKNSKSTPDFGGVHDSMWRDPQSISRASTPCWQAMLSRHLESQSSQPLSEALRQERGPPIRNVQSTPDLGSPHDSIWQGPQSSSRASTPSWQAMLSRHMESLALRSTAQVPQKGRPASRTQPQPGLLPSQPTLGEQPQPDPNAHRQDERPVCILPPPQPQPAFPLEQRQNPANTQALAPEPPQRPITRRSNQSEKTGPGTMIPPVATRSARHTSPPRSITTQPSPAPPPPAADIAAVFLTIYEVRYNNCEMPVRQRASRRSRSIMLQRNIGINNFSEYCCIPTPHRRPRRHLQFFSTHDLPNPLDNAPGLLSMIFIAWVPPQRIDMLDTLMVTLRRRVNDSWHHTTWINVYLQLMVEQGLITQQRSLEVLDMQQQALNLPYTEDLPNVRRCFPDDK